MESKFLSNLSVELLADKNLWKLTEDLVYQSKILNKRITVKKGFISDFASVPRIPIIYALYGDKVHRESVIHDYLYRIKKYSRCAADRVFLEAMKARKKRFYIRWIMFLGVRLGGYFAFRRLINYEEI